MLFVIPAVGAVVFDVTVILSVSVQLLPSVTVTVYVLALLIVAAALLPKLLSQLYELPPLAVTLIDVVAHVSSVEPVLFVITAVGNAVICYHYIISCCCTRTVRYLSILV